MGKALALAERTKAMPLQDSKTAELSQFQTVAAVSESQLVHLASVLRALKRSRMVAKGFKPTSEEHI